MQVNSINPQYRAYTANSVSMSGSAAAKKVVVGKVMQFLKDNSLMFLGEARLSPVHSNVCEFANVIVNEHILVGMKKEPFYLLAKEGAKEQELLFNGTSMDDIAYQFAKQASGKTLYNPAIAQHASGMWLLGGSTKGYKARIKVPNFFN